MFRYLIILILVSSVQFINLNADELVFKKGSWDEIKTLAQKENKLIFLDAYTDWCGWCKVLDKNTFTDKDVIDFINKHFIPVKYEMETGIGRTLAMKYRVRGFPSQLFFSPEGNLIYISSGYQPPPGFLEMLAKAANKENHFNLQGISSKLDLDFPDFYKAAFAKNGSPEKKFPTNEEVVKFLEGRDNLMDELSWCVLSEFESNEKFNNYFLENIAEYERLYGSHSTRGKLYNLLYNKIRPAFESKDEKVLNDVLAMIDKYDKKTAAENQLYYKTLFYERTNNWIKYADVMEQQINDGKMNDDQINDKCWGIYEKCDNHEVLQKAVKWMKPVVERNINYMNADTYAVLLYKTKNYSEAAKYAEKAIEIGRKDKSDIKATEELLEKIKAEMK